MSTPAGWAVVLTLGVPALVQAQTQLFPLAHIQRQRPPCPMEDPVYGLYRQQYFGYFPTCWRAFPAGWGCPSPEAPNAEAAFVKQPRDKLPDYSSIPGEGPGMAPLPGEEPAMPGGRPALPPAGRSPFDEPVNPAPNPNAIPPAARNAAPIVPGGGATNLQARRVAPAPARLPALSRRIDPPQALPEAKEEASDGPGLLALPEPIEASPAPGRSEGVVEPGSSNSSPTGTGAASPAPAQAGILLAPATGAEAEPGGAAAAGSFAAGAIAALPGPVEAPSSTGTIINPAPAPLPAPLPLPAPAPASATTEGPATDMTAAPASAPVQAPQRRGPISSLFNGMTSWLRR